MNYDFYQFHEAIHHEAIWLRRPLQADDKTYPLMVFYAGYSRCYKGWQIYRKKSDIFAIEFVCGGDACLVQDGVKHIITKGSAFILRKNAEHTYSVGPSGVLLKRFITIDGIELENLLRVLDLWGKDVIIIKQPELFLKLLKQFTHMLSDKTSEQTDIRFSCMIYNVLLLLFQSLESEIPPVIANAVDYIQNNLHRSLSRKELSEHLGISIPHFNRIFFAHYKCSPIKYFLARKMNWAAQLILKTNYSIKEISYMIGFTDPLYFSSQFKKHFGISPRKYRSNG